MLLENYLVYNLLIIGHENKQYLSQFLKEIIRVTEHDVEIDFKRILKHHGNSETNETAFNGKYLVFLYQMYNKEDICERLRKTFLSDIKTILYPTYETVYKNDLKSTYPQLLELMESDTLASTEVIKEAIKEASKLLPVSSFIDFTDVEDEHGRIDFTTVVEINEVKEANNLHSYNENHYIADVFTRINEDVEQLYYLDENDGNIILGFPTVGIDGTIIAETLMEEYGFTVQLYVGQKVKAAHYIFDDGKHLLSVKEPSLDDLSYYLNKLGNFDNVIHYFNWQADMLNDRYLDEEDIASLPVNGIE